MELEGTYILNDEDLDQCLLQNNKLRIERNRTKENGCLKYDDCDVYSYKLATLFSSKELNLYEQNSSSIKQIIGWELIDIYRGAYEDGVKHFDDLFQSINWWGENSELIIDSLHQHCYHTRHDEHGFKRPWMDILFKEPYVLSNKVLVTYGFYSGILSKVYYFINKYKAVFNKYDTGKNCTTCKTEKLEDLNSSKISVQSPNKENNYCIGKIQIASLHELFTAKKIIEPIDCEDFMKCFDLNNEPVKKPKYLHQNTMGYALSLIKNSNNQNAINQKIALKNFGIKNYDAVKSQIKRSYPIETLLKYKIEQIL